MVQVATIWGYPHDIGQPPFRTHHSFWEAALQDLGHNVTRFHWENWQDMPKTFDLYLFIDFHPSLYHIPKHNLKNVCMYWWDNFHFPMAIVLQVAESFERCYFAEFISASCARTYGFPVTWLPASFYEGVYRPLPDRTKIHDYAFVGQQDSVIVRKGDTKRDFISKLGLTPGVHGYVGQGVYGHDVNSIYNDAKVLFERTVFPTIGTRFFETIGSGGFLLLNRLRPYNGIEHLATDGIHYATYDDSFKDFEQKLMYWAMHDEERDKIARAGHAHFSSHHTYARRVRRILSDFNLE